MNFEIQGHIKDTIYTATKCYMDTDFFKIRQSAFIGLSKSHSIIRGRVKFVHLTVLIQEPKMSDKMYKKWHVMEIF
jgi:hypothetical protein